jgi:acid-sensing ion channel, other
MNGRLNSCWHKVADLFADYTDHSTVHGFNYIGEKGRPWYERIWWITVFCISVVCCARLVNDAYNINPIIISFAEKPVPIWQVSCMDSGKVVK